ncbi:glycoside hydrolase domain-containing protein [Streptomyces sp. CB01881]|uniref:glycoside hydrolase domain-containing protein n=1 Tax=Streptomyces sp. CB01881 TaxID=2078691 RepID=UPI000CDCB953|nr:glycoside hydrolase domain-containing protein [Streptomyces sp. CB01881]AUY52491.1 hypothetical protein C2142_30270 [Streptomyces sp. CB01881]TYC71920.1 DUF1906 domain-containing protein [Streptomyces sp. CB01881]
MDAKVLEAQKWVNSTYGAVSGFVRAPEDGKTSWATMYALTRALQFELGITTLSNSFGPGTLSALAARGDIGPAEKNANLVKIIQGACYCKGYEPGGITGTYTAGTGKAINSMMGNAGLGARANGNLSPKVFKALLTMDAYVVVAGGNGGVAGLQRWLNATYIDRAQFFVMPCDGYFSRDVQKALMFAIQYELGMTDAEANGLFGPGTQRGLRTKTLEQGMQGRFVEIFSAAMVFNGQMSAFQSTFDSDLASKVEDFQQFSGLEVTRKADFATWAELLVSTGDPSRRGTAADCVQTVTDARAKALKEAGHVVIGRYLDERPSKEPLNKAIQPGELETIFANGLRVFPISQYYGRDVTYFTDKQGYTDAVDAHTAALKYGFDRGTVIYFAVDYDATQDEINRFIIPYFKGIVAGLNSRGKRYIHGVYGSRNVCAQVTRHTFARFSFVSGMSTGFSGNMGFPLPGNWSFNQIATISVGSGDGKISIDKNVHRPDQDPGVSSVNNPGAPADAFLKMLEDLYALSVKYDDKVYSHSERIMQYLRHPKYTGAQWDVLVNAPSQGFIDYVKNSGFTPMKKFLDPSTGVMLSTDHWAAAANGAFQWLLPGGNGINGGDMAGWGGDLCTFYAEWRRDHATYSSGYTYAMDRLAKIDVDTTFGFNDLIEDVDGFLIGSAVKKGATIIDAARSMYTDGGHVARYQRFYEARFGGTPDKLTKVTEEMLTGGDVTISAGRTLVITDLAGLDTLMPSMLPDDKFDEFVQGFTKTLLDRVAQETGKPANLSAPSPKEPS